MSKENTSIHDFDVNLICEYFSGIERQGPGSRSVTRKALGFIDNLSESSEILDIGCGTGGQTITIAQNALGRIIGLDLFPVFLDKFNENVKSHHLEKRIKSVRASMEDMPFKNQQFDLIWSEGAIYNIGFERGLKEWCRFIKKDGYIAVTEVAWLTDQRPDEIETFWNDAYPEIDTISVKIAQMQKVGYLPVAVFVLPEDCWTVNFYEPQEKAQKLFLEKYAGNSTAEALVSNEKREAEMYQKYKAYYSYVFFIGRKI